MSNPRTLEEITDEEIADEIAGFGMFGFDFNIRRDALGRRLGIYSVIPYGELDFVENELADRLERIKDSGEIVEPWGSWLFCTSPRSWAARLRGKGQEEIERLLRGNPEE